MFGLLRVASHSSPLIIKMVDKLPNDMLWEIVQYFNNPIDFISLMFCCKDIYSFLITQKHMCCRLTLEVLKKPEYKNVYVNSIEIMDDNMTCDEAIAIMEYFPNLGEIKIKYYSTLTKTRSLFIKHGSKFKEAIHLRGIYLTILSHEDLIRRMMK
jgi:hypothetical protein